jgi:Na+-transporting methylmalonyl-CoA/oxaloacetate decarboxylase gamma subunit
MSAVAMDNLIWGLQMTGLGMGLVFGLLALLWGLLTIVLRLDQPAAVRASTPAPEAAATLAKPTPPSVQGLDAELVAAIVVATHLHRAVRRQEAAPVMRSYWPGSQLYASRWLGAGRSRQNHSWQRRSR